MELKDLRSLAGLSECGAGPMPSAPPSPATVSMTAASGHELSSMLKDIMSLAGMSKVEPAQLGVVPPPMKMAPEPVKVVGPAASDGEVMRGIVDKMNMDKDEAEEKKADEAWDNAPDSPEPKEPFDAEALANHENPPGAGKGRRTMQPNATVEQIEAKLKEEYKNFVVEDSEAEEGVIGGALGGLAGAAMGGLPGAALGYVAGSKAGDDLSNESAKGALIKKLQRAVDGYLEKKGIAHAWRSEDTVVVPDKYVDELEAFFDEKAMGYIQVVGMSSRDDDAGDDDQEPDVFDKDDDDDNTKAVSFDKPKVGRYSDYDDSDDWGSDRR